jgi:predicted TIM-barrel enzyme
MMNRKEVLAKLRNCRANGQPIVGAGIGLGLVAKCAEAGGADLMVLYSSGRFRMAGRGSMAGLMPYGDANAIVLELASEVLPIIRHTPVLAGVCGTDPFRQMPIFLAQLKDLGFTGVQNFPTVGLFDGAIRQNFEETGMGFGCEVDVIRLAHGLDLLTCPYVFNEDEARAMVEAGADLLVAHVGLTSTGKIGAMTTITLNDAVKRIQAVHDAAKRVRKDILVLCHGGPIAEPQDVAYILQNTPGIDGFFGGSSMDRLPTERAITEQVRRFKGIGRGTLQVGDQT